MVIAAAAVGCLALLPVTSPPAAARAARATPRPGSTYSSATRFRRLEGEPGRPRGPVASAPVAGCERKLERARRQRHDRQGVPALAIAGASFTAGVGLGSPGKSWAAVLARRLHWDAVIYGDPGAGYVRAGIARQGPVAAEIARLDLRALAPAVVIVQAGHDDIGVPPQLEQRRGEHAVTPLPAPAPRARVALPTPFSPRPRSAAASPPDPALPPARPAPGPT